MRRRRLYGVLLTMSLSLVIGCGGDEDVASASDDFFSQPASPTSPSPVAATPVTTAEARPGEGSARSGEPPEGIVRKEFADGSRDPFMRQFPENQTPFEFDADVDLGAEEVVDLGPLANYPIESLRLVAIMTRTAEPKAMFMLPDGGGLAVLARVEDRVGPNGTGRIVDIQPNRVIVSYEGFGFGEEGEQARTLVLTLRDPSLDIEAVFEPY